MASIFTIQQWLNQSEINTTGRVQWAGENGEYAILSAMNDNMLSRGIYAIPYNSSGTPDFATLGSLSGGDTRFAIVQGAGLYRYNPDGQNPAVTSLGAFGGGVWDLWMLSVKPQDTLSQNAGTTTYTITHTQNTTTPTILVYKKNLSGQPGVLDTTGTITIISSSSFSLVYGLPTTTDFFVVVKQ